MVELKNYKGTRIAQCFTNVNETPEETIRLKLQSNFEKGLIDKDLFLKASKQLDDLIEKAKYIKREGTPGNYKYTYDHGNGKHVQAEASNGEIKVDGQKVGNYEYDEDSDAFWVNGKVFGKDGDVSFNEKEEMIEAFMKLKKKKSESKNESAQDREAFALDNKAEVNDIQKGGKGEGSRGGRVIGHTQSGKPIYANSSHDSHKNFSSQDHTDAAELHQAYAERHQGDSTLANKNEKVQNHIKHSEAHYTASMGGAKNHGTARDNAKRQVYDHKYHFDQMKYHQKAGEEAEKNGKLAEGLHHYEQAAKHSNEFINKKQIAEGRIGHTSSGKPVYLGKTADSKHYKDFSAQDHEDAAEIRKKHWQENDHDKDGLHHAKTNAEINSHSFAAINARNKGK